MTKLVVVTTAIALTAALASVSALAFAPTIWTLMLAGVVLVAGAGAVTRAVTRAMDQDDT